jgi:AbrB family looped-hinge helix DNA binding protein
MFAAALVFPPPARGQTSCPPTKLVRGAAGGRVAYGRSLPPPWFPWEPLWRSSPPSLDAPVNKSDNLIMGITDTTETARIGRRGTVVLPARLRRKYSLEEGTLVVVEERPEGLMLRPAVAYPVEMYPPARVAEFLLNNAVDQDDYKSAVEEVRRLGIDPEDVPHRKP